MNTIQSESSHEVAPGVFAHIRPAKVVGVSDTEEYTAFVSWFADADGNLLGQYTCTCKTSTCNASKSCENGNYESCDCARCRLKCS